jgi:23S rRNA (cytosine1962-C5)-methyltransferase
MARAGNTVTHVDASRTALTWARENAARNGLADAPIRWIVDDAAQFVAREARRARRYRGAVVDPPSYGHGPRGQTWRIERDLPGLVELVQTVLEPEAWILVTSHTAGHDLGTVLAGSEPVAMELRATSGAVLGAGHYVRWPAT